MSPLDDITVVTLEQAIAAPFCTRQLADMGARVIKVERPGTGDFARGYDERVRGLASHFVWTNRSKESLTLDIKRPEAAEILRRLLNASDVPVQNLAPGAAARLGLSFEALHERFPRLIVCDISGYASDGPYRDKKAYDLLVQSEAGFVSVTGTEDEPAKAGLSIADIAAGMYGYSNILAALIQRGRTGRGCRIDVSLQESMVEWMGYALYYSYDGAPPPPRTGAAHATIYPYGPYPAGDSGVVMLGLQNEREWRVFCERILERLELAKDPRFSANSRRVENREALYALIVEAFAEKSTDDAVARLDDAGIANARMNDMHHVWEHAQLAARGRWVGVARRRAQSRPCYRPGRRARLLPAWTPFRRWGSIPMPSYRSLVMTNLSLPGCVRLRQSKACFTVVYVDNAVTRQSGKCTPNGAGSNLTAAAFKKIPFLHHPRQLSTNRRQIVIVALSTAQKGPVVINRQLPPPARQHVGVNAQNRGQFGHR